MSTCAFLKQIDSAGFASQLNYHDPLRAARFVWMDGRGQEVAETDWFRLRFPVSCPNARKYKEAGKL